MTSFERTTITPTPLPRGGHGNATALKLFRKVDGMCQGISRRLVSCHHKRLTHPYINIQKVQKTFAFHTPVQFHTGVHSTSGGIFWYQKDSSLIETFELEKRAGFFYTFNYKSGLDWTRQFLLFNLKIKTDIYRIKTHRTLNWKQNGNSLSAAGETWKLDGSDAQK